MGLFGFGKKEKKKEVSCCCGNAQTDAFETSGGCCCDGKEEKIVSIKVLGAGCKSCHEQYENCKKAVLELGIDVEVEYITDMEKVMTYGVMSMPAIVINEQVASYGKVLKSTDVVALIHKLGY